MDNEFSILTRSLQSEIELADDHFESENELRNAIYARVKHLLEKDPELLMSYLYRLDVPEKQVKEAFYSKQIEDPVLELSNLIFQRQLQRVKTKKTYKQSSIDGWEW